jgi:integrase
MARTLSPFVIQERNDVNKSKTFRLTLSTKSGLPNPVCVKWQRKSFKNFPDALSIYRYPRNKAEAMAGALALIEYFKQMLIHCPSSPEISPVLDHSFIKYIKDFWTLEGDYVQEHIAIGKPLSKGYVLQNHRDIGLYIEPFEPFKNLLIGNLKSGIIRNWITWALKKGLSHRRINSLLKVMRVPVRDLASREDIEFNPFLRIKDLEEKAKEKGILTFLEVFQLVHAPIVNPTTRLTMLLGVLCGMRKGEIKGLQWEDIQDSTIKLSHNWQYLDGLKSPKCGSYRIIPIPSYVALLLAELQKTSLAEGFVLKSKNDPQKPVCDYFIQYTALANELEAIGITIDEQKQRNITFHSLRHTFITLARLAGMSDIEIQTLAGHHSLKMTNRYSHPQQVMDYTKTRTRMESIVAPLLIEDADADTV